MRGKKLSGFTLIELMIVVSVIGILAAVAIPAFMKNVRKAKTTEATVNVKKILDGAISYYHEEQVTGGTVGTPIQRQFPGASGAALLEPATDCCSSGNGVGGKCAPNPAWWAAPSWQALKFAVNDPHYYQYGYVRRGTGKGGFGAPSLPGGGTASEYFYADAMGNLNCDAVYSTFEVAGVVDAQGDVTSSGGMFKDNELE